mgnify:CR=1 FL=1
MFINTIRAISLKNYNKWEKKGDCVCHVLPEYNEDMWGYNSYRDLTCALEDYPRSRVPVFGEAITRNLSIKSYLLAYSVKFKFAVISNQAVFY